MDAAGCATSLLRPRADVALLCRLIDPPVTISC